MLNNILLQDIYCLDNNADSVIKIFPEIIISAKRDYSLPAIKFNAINNISLSELDLKDAVQLSEALKDIPGAYILDYGGLAGIKTISMRGTNSQQTLVMIDGMKISSSQNGSYDLGLLPISLIDNIEIIRGGCSSIFGSNAIGGAVNIVTNNANFNDNINANIKYGSYNEILSKIALNKHIDSQLVINTSLEYIDSKGNFIFNNQQFGSNTLLERKNNNYSNVAYNISSIYNFDDYILKLFLFGNSSNKGVPGAVVQGKVESGAKINNNNINILTSLIKYFKNDNKLNISVLYSANNMHYKEDTVQGQVFYLNNNYFSRDITLSAKYLFNLNDWNFQFGNDCGFSDLSGNMLESVIGTYVKRNTYAANIYIEKSLINDKLGYFNFQFGTRLDLIYKFEPSITYLFGIIYVPKIDNVMAKLQYSTNFRTPSFNELYFYEYGNPDLKSEKSKSLNLGITFNPLKYINIEANSFLISTNNQIVSSAISPVLSQAENIGNVFTRGIELYSNVNIFDNILISRISYTRQIATNQSRSSNNYGKQIVYIPQEIIAYSIIYNNHNITFDIDCNYSSYRYTMSDNSYSSILPSYITANTFIEYNYELPSAILKFRLQCNNIFNENYEIINNYPMPGRIFRAGIRATFKNL